MNDGWRTVVLWIVVAALWTGVAAFMSRLRESENSVTAVYGIRGDSLGESNAEQ
jgi:hypothetical protein